MRHYHEFDYLLLGFISHRYWSILSLNGFHTIIQLIHQAPGDNVSCEADSCRLA